MDQWGDIPWKTFEKAFYGAENLTSGATGLPDLSNVTSLIEMFRGASSFNGDIGGWDVSGVTYMAAMFSFAPLFNQDIGGWNVSAVTDMSDMFRIASVFNQDIGSWIVSALTDMNEMFRAILLIRDTSIVVPDTSIAISDTSVVTPPEVSEPPVADPPVASRSQEFRVYPNPSQGRIRISLPQPGQFNFTLFNHLGKRVKTGAIENGSAIVLMGQHDGIYYIQVEKDSVFSGVSAVLLVSLK